MKIEYGVELTMAEVVEALVSVWDEERFNAAEPVREWTPGSDEEGAEQMFVVYRITPDGKRRNLATLDSEDKAQLGVRNCYIHPAIAGSAYHYEKTAAYGNPFGEFKEEAK